MRSWFGPILNRPAAAFSNPSITCGAQCPLLLAFRMLFDNKTLTQAMANNFTQSKTNTLALVFTFLRG